jgi:hypothetical protein
MSGSFPVPCKRHQKEKALVQGIQDALYLLSHDLDLDQPLQLGLLELVLVESGRKTSSKMLSQQKNMLAVLTVNTRGSYRHSWHRSSENISFPIDPPFSYPVLFYVLTSTSGASWFLYLSLSQTCFW